MKEILIKQKSYLAPLYFPDATRGVVKSLDSTDLCQAGVEGVVVNSLHLADNPGLEILDQIGGIKNMMNYHGIVTSDSGGWQVFSLIHRNGNKGKITDEGVIFTIGTTRKQVFTPKQSITTQMCIGSDIVICLDDFTPPDAPQRIIRETVDRTILWAKQCKKTYQEECDSRNLSEGEKPLLLAVVQGGYSKEERKRCSEELINIGFDAYGFGGYAIKEETGLDLEISQYIADNLPKESIKFALGFGKPHDIVTLRKFGWDIFDCTLPTRDARHQRLYVFNNNQVDQDVLNDKKTFGFLDIGKSIYKTDQSPIDQYCDCHTCKNFSRAYLHHLFKIKDNTALRLAAIHNVRHFTRVTDLLK